MKKNLEQILTQKAKSIRVIYVSSYIPRHCGIATYTKDLTNAINLLNPYALAEIMAVNRLGDVPDYPWEVKFKINQDDLSTYLQAADYINQSGAHLVFLQHEFGLFGGHCGEYIVPFIERLKRPLMTTLHTVVSDPKSDYGIIIKRLIKKSKAVIVMMKKIKEKLVIDYGAQPKKIIVIPHGAPDLPYSPTEKFKKKRKLAGKIVLGNINLLSKAKGIEYALKAVAIISQKYPNVLYLVIGQTHPVVLQNEGEKYRNFLKQKVKKLGISGNVKFVNEYLSLDELLDWLRAIDIYITPYLNPQQSASGALAYAIGAGKPCISTPYLYAKEVLSDRRGILVPFRDSNSIAQVVIYLWENPEKRKEIEKNAYSYGRLMTWPNVALKHLDLFRIILKRDEK
jgi:glycosyltransferase involved in cell wall biosynthesis